MIHSRYFRPARKNGGPVPAPLAASVTRVVRFNEIDPLNVMWHGHYASYFEDARIAFGARYGLEYETIRNSGYVTPIKRIQVDYDAPLRFGQECRIFAALFWNEAARLDFEYAICDAAGHVVTRGCTVQLFVTPLGDLQYAVPDFYERFRARWRADGFTGEAAAESALAPWPE